MSWVAAAVAAVGVGGKIASAISGNQQKQRNKGYIDQNYRLAQQRMVTNQRNTREETGESLAARGLSPIAGAMMGSGPGGAPHTVGEQTGTDLESQFGLERQDLNNQRDQAVKENNAQYTGTLINAGIGAAGDIAGGFSLHQDIASAGRMNAMASGSSPVRSAMLSGGPSEMGGSRMDAIIDPLGHPASPWYTGGKQSTFNASPGTSNADFNVGEG